MGIQTEQAVIDLKINADAAAANITQMNTRIKELTKTIEGMHKADNPALYESRKAQLNALIVARDAERTAIFATSAAIKQQQAELTKAMSAAKEQASSAGGALQALKTGFESLGIGVSIGLLVSWGKELVNFESKASGIEQAFSKIADTSGLIDKMRVASRGLISDLDLEKIAIKANNANIPIGKLSTLLEFAAQRARDTGEDVTALTEKLITGLGRGGTRSLTALGLSAKEVKLEFKKTGDMVTAVSNIIEREMAKSGKDVDTFGDKVGQLGTWFKNLASMAGRALQGVFTPELADAKVIEVYKEGEMKRYKSLEKLKDDELADAIKSQEARVAKLNESYQAAQKKIAGTGTMKKLLDASVGRVDPDILNAKAQAEAYQGARNALAALNHEKSNREVNQESDEDKAAKAEKAREKAARELQNYQNQLMAVRAQIDSLISKSTKGTIDGLDEQLKVINDKYQTLIAKLKQLNGNKNATSTDKEKNNGLIKELGIDNASDQLLTANDSDYKNDSSILKKEYSGKKDTNKDNYAKGLISKKTYEAQLYKLEQEELEKEYMLRVTYGQSTQSVEDALANNEVANKKKIFDASIAYLRLERKENEDFFKAKQDIANAEQALATSGFNVLNDLFGKNKALMLAELAIEKVVAIGKIEAAEGVEIAKYWAAYGVTAPYLAIALSGMAVTRANLSIAGIIVEGVAAAIGDLGGGSSKSKFADGGFVPDGPSHSAGGINLVGPYGKVMGNVEGGEPILSKKTYANNKGVIDALLGSKGKTLNYDRISNATTSREIRHGGTTSTPAPVNGGSSSTSNAADLSLTNQKLDDLHETFKQFVNKPWEFPMKQFYIADNKNKQVQGNANA